MLICWNFEKQYRNSVIWIGSKMALNSWEFNNNTTILPVCHIYSTDKNQRNQLNEIKLVNSGSLTLLISQLGPWMLAFATKNTCRLNRKESNIFGGDIMYCHFKLESAVSNDVKLIILTFSNQINWNESRQTIILRRKKTFQLIWK